MPKVGHFEINSQDPEKSVKFYANVFGWFIQKKWTGNEDYWLIITGRSDEGGINGGIKKNITPSPSAIFRVHVTNIDEIAGKVIENGGKLLGPKITIPESGYLLYCLDAEGIPFSLIQKDPAAKLENENP